MTTREDANRFLRPLIAEFNAKFTTPAAEKGSAFRRPTRTDLDWIFTVQTERSVAKDNTFTLQNQIWQLDQTRWRHSLAGCTVTIHEHLDETFRSAMGHMWWAAMTPTGPPYAPERRGKGSGGSSGKPKTVSQRSHRSLEISPTARFPFPPRLLRFLPKPKKSKPGNRAA